MRVTFLTISLIQDQRHYLGFLTREGLYLHTCWHKQLTPEDLAETILPLDTDTDQRQKFREWADQLLDRKNSGDALLRIINGAQSD